MRFSRVCDSMNVTGCDKWYQKMNDGSISSHLINYEIEYGFLFAAVFIAGFFYWYFNYYAKKGVKK